MAAANTACEPCAAGSFAPHSAMTACETCPADTFSSLGIAPCDNCSAHEFSTPDADSSEDCLCVTGFFRPAGFDSNSSAYAPCALGFFRNTTHAQDWGSLACLPCPAGFSTLSVAMVSADGCQQCPAGAYTSDRGELGVTWMFRLFITERKGNIHWNVPSRVEASKAALKQLPACHATRGKTEEPYDPQRTTT